MKVLIIGSGGCEGTGIRQMVNTLKKEFPEIEFGYFSQPVRK